MARSACIMSRAQIVRMEAQQTLTRYLRAKSQPLMTYSLIYCNGKDVAFKMSSSSLSSNPTELDRDYGRLVIPARTARSAQIIAAAWRGCAGGSPSSVLLPLPSRVRTPARPSYCAQLSRLKEKNSLILSYSGLFCVFPGPHTSVSHVAYFFEVELQFSSPREHGEAGCRLLLPGSL